MSIKSLILSTFDNVGGASRSAYRLHQGLRHLGLDSRILSQTKLSHDPDVTGRFGFRNRLFNRARNEINQLPLAIYRNKKRILFSTEWATTDVVKQTREINPDIINLHWICKGFVRPEDVPMFQKPIVWTFHDMWAFTGGCHYDENCGRYKINCGRCPILQSDVDQDTSRWVWNRKKEAWRNLKQVVITPSHWLSKAAQESDLFREADVQTIPYGIDLTLFKPMDKSVARKKWNLPRDKKIVLFIAFGIDDPRKGFHFFKDALNSIVASGRGQNLELAIIGASDSQSQFGINLPVHDLGLINNDLDLATIYSASDVFMAPSVQDNLPNTVIESLACGTPTVAFRIGGMPDMIQHHVNGYLATPFEIEELSQGLIWALENPNRLKTLGQAASELAAAQFPLELQAKRYQDVYTSTIESYRRKT